MVYDDFKGGDEIGFKGSELDAFNTFIDMASKSSVEYVALYKDEPSEFSNLTFIVSYDTNEGFSDILHV